MKKCLSLFLAVAIILGGVTGYIPIIEPLVTKTEATTAQRVVDIANGQVGKNGSTYKNWYGLQDQWCVMFTSWVASQAGISTSVIPKAASVGVVRTFAINHGRYINKSEAPIPGDMVIIGTSAGATQHINIVVAVSGDTVTTVGGNEGGTTHTNSTVRKNQWNWKNSRFGSQYVLGWFRPAYTSNHTHSFEYYDSKSKSPLYPYIVTVSGWLYARPEAGQEHVKAGGLEYEAQSRCTSCGWWEVSGWTPESGYATNLWAPNSAVTPVLPNVHAYPYKNGLSHWDSGGITFTTKEHVNFNVKHNGKMVSYTDYNKPGGSQTVSGSNLPDIKANADNYLSFGFRPVGTYDFKFVTTKGGKNIEHSTWVRVIEPEAIEEGEYVISQTSSPKPLAIAPDKQGFNSCYVSLYGDEKSKEDKYWKIESANNPDKPNSYHIKTQAGTYLSAPLDVRAQGAKVCAYTYKPAGNTTAAEWYFVRSGNSYKIYNSLYGTLLDTTKYEANNPVCLWTSYKGESLSQDYTLEKRPHVCENKCACEVCICDCVNKACHDCGVCENCNPSHTCNNKCICTVCICDCINKICHDCGSENCEICNPPHTCNNKCICDVCDCNCLNKACHNCGVCESCDPHSYCNKCICADCICDCINKICHDCGSGNCEVCYPGIGDDTSPIIGVTETSGKAGDTITAYVEASNASVELATLEFKLGYSEDSLTLKSAALSGDSGFNSIILPKLSSGTLFTFFPKSVNTVNPNGRILELTFEINAEAEAGTYAISLFEVAANDENGKTIPFRATIGSITVTEETVIPGCFTGLGDRPNGTDVLWLQRYIACGRNLEAMLEIFPTTITTFNEAAAFFTNGRTVTGVDILWLQRYIACGRNVDVMLENFPTTIDFSHLRSANPVVAANHVPLIGVSNMLSTSILATSESVKSNVLELTSNDEVVKKGNTFTVNLNLDLQQGEDIAALEFYLGYDDTALRLVTYDFPGTLHTPFVFGNFFTLSPKGVTPQTESGNIVTFTFEVLDDSQSAFIEIVLDYAENQNRSGISLVEPTALIINKQGEEYSCNTCLDSGEHCLACCSAVECEACNFFEKGDVNGDDTIAIADAIEILKYLARLPSIIDYNANAFNAALIVSYDAPKIADAIEILKFIAGMASCMG